MSLIIFFSLSGLFCFFLFLSVNSFNLFISKMVIKATFQMIYPFSSESYPTNYTFYRICVKLCYWKSWFYYNAFYFVSYLSHKSKYSIFDTCNKFYFWSFEHLGSKIRYFKERIRLATCPVRVVLLACLKKIKFYRIIKTIYLKTIW